MKEVKALAEPDKKFLITLAHTIDDLTGIMRKLASRVEAIEGKPKEIIPEVILSQVAAGPDYPNMYILFNSSEEVNIYNPQTLALQAAVNTFCASTPVKQVWVSFINKK